MQTQGSGEVEPKPKGRARRSQPLEVGRGKAHGLGVGRGGAHCKAYLLWTLVFDNQHNQIGLMNLQVICFVVQYGVRRDLDEGDVMIR